MENRDGDRGEPWGKRACSWVGTWVRATCGAQSKMKMQGSGSTKWGKWAVNGPEIQSFVLSST